MAYEASRKISLILAGWLWVEVILEVARPVGRPLQVQRARGLQEGLRSFISVVGLDELDDEPHSRVGGQGGAAPERGSNAAGEIWPRHFSQDNGG